jgi:hypothetical protein
MFDPRAEVATLRSIRHDLVAVDGVNSKTSADDVLA